MSQALCCGKWRKKSTQADIAIFYHTDYCNYHVKYLNGQELTRSISPLATPSFKHFNENL